MKVKMEFDLYEDADDFDMCYKGIEAHTVLRELDETMRSWLKHGHDIKGADQAIDVIRDMLKNLAIEHDLKLP